MRPMHVISENEEDATSVLALPPTRGSGQNAADFINSQAIQARCLAQSLAYPELKEVVADLITHGGTTASVLAETSLFLPKTDALVPFGVVQELVHRHAGRVFGPSKSALCIGIVDAKGKTAYPD